MKKPRKPFKKVIIKSRKITEPTVIPATVEVKVYPPVYVEQKDPEKSIIPADWERLASVSYDLLKQRFNWNGDYNPKPKSKNKQYMISWRWDV